MGLISFLKSPSVADYFELEAEKKKAKEKGEPFDENEWIKNKKRDRTRNSVTREQEPIRCPKCGSTQITADKKGFGIGKAIAGDIVAGPVAGLITGSIGKDKVMITCLKCGHTWKAGKAK